MATPPAAVSRHRALRPPSPSRLPRSPSRLPRSLSRPARSSRRRCHPPTLGTSRRSSTPRFRSSSLRGAVVEPAEPAEPTAPAVPEPAPDAEEPGSPTGEIDPTEGRLDRLRGRLARSQSGGRAGPARPARRRRPRRGLLGGGRGHAADRRPRPGHDTEIVEHAAQQWPRAVAPKQARALLREVLAAPCARRSTVRSARCRTTARRRCCWSSESTAPARPPPPASSPGCWSPTAGECCSVRPTRSAPLPRSS